TLSTVSLLHSLSLHDALPIFDRFTFTTDGSTPSFYENGLINVCIEIAIENGIPIEEAYKMASYNVAKHFRLDEDLGSIAPGKIADRKSTRLNSSHVSTSYAVF